MLCRVNWLLLRGLTRETRHWGTFPETLAAHLPAAKVQCLDLPGVGRERGQPAPFTIAATTEDVRQRWLMLAAAGGSPAREWGVLGMSLGGMVALDWVSRHPRDFQRAVLVNTSAGRSCPPLCRLRPHSLRALVPIVLARTPMAREAGVLSLISARSENREARVAEWAAIAEDAPVTARVLARQLLAAARFRGPPTLGVKVLFLASQGDRLVNARCSERLARQYHASLSLHPSAGHDLALDDPGWVGERVAAWLAKDA